MKNKTPRFTNITVDGPKFDGLDNNNPFAADISLFIIREAWRKGVGFEDLADGFGEGMGTNGDWSAVRDSSPNAVNKMFERSLNHFFGK